MPVLRRNLSKRKLKICFDAILYSLNLFGTSYDIQIIFSGDSKKFHLLHDNKSTTYFKRHLIYLICRGPSSMWYKKSRPLIAHFYRFPHSSSVYICFSSQLESLLISPSFMVRTNFLRHLLSWKRSGSDDLVEFSQVSAECTFNLLLLRAINYHVIKSCQSKPKNALILVGMHLIKFSFLYVSEKNLK